MLSFSERKKIKGITFFRKKFKSDILNFHDVNYRFWKKPHKVEVIYLFWFSSLFLESSNSSWKRKMQVTLMKIPVHKSEVRNYNNII